MERDRIRRAVPVVAAWCGAAVVAAVVTSQGVALVTREVTDRRPASLSSPEIAARLEDVQATTTTRRATTTTTPGTDASTTTTTGAAPATAAPGPTSASTTTGAGPGGTAPATTQPPSPTTSPPASETRTYPLQGGTVALEFSSSGVRVVYATPAAGFDVDIEPEHGNGVKVEFESEGHRSRVDGWWEGGPVDRVREEDA